MSNINYSIIAAVSDNNVIGKNGQLPWHLKTDLQRFKKLTENHAIIMGRKCFNSIGKPLPNRTNVIVSSQPGLEIEGCIVKPSLQFAVDYVNSRYDSSPFIIGGGTIYKQCINLVNYMYITKVHTTVEDGDTFFPEYDPNKWEVIHSEEIKAEDGDDFDSTYIILKRKR